MDTSTQPATVAGNELGKSGIREGIILIEINDSINDPLASMDLDLASGSSYGSGSLEPIRAQSLNRLDSMIQGDNMHCSGSGAYYVYKFPSFPSLDRNASGGSARTLSTAHLETDSLSPRVSTTTLSQDLEYERLSFGQEDTRFPTQSAGGSKVMENESPDVRSQEASIDPRPTRTVPTFVTNLVPRKSSKVCRSTSCPSIEYARRCIAGPGGMILYREDSSVTDAECGPGVRRVYVTNRDGPNHLSSRLRDDLNVDLVGEVILDLPVQPLKHYPNFIPEVIKEDVGASSKKLPICRDSVDIKRAVVKLDSSLSAIASSLNTSKRHGDRFKTSSLFQHDCRSTSSSGHHQRECAFVNIGDMPPNVVHHVISDHHEYRQRAPHLVQIKCLQWLNSLDNDR